MILNIRGRQYNLTGFNHPGGNEILELSKNEPDCTALFESYHAFCDTKKIDSMMKKYEIKDSTAANMFLFEQDGFYNVLKGRVKEYLATRFGKEKLQRSDVKATLWWYLLVSIQTMLFIGLQYQLLFGTIGVVRAVCGFASGVTIIGIGFNLLHDGSHYAISTNPKVNQMASSLIQGMLCWNHVLWTVHHAIRHHQYTGMIEYDPDMRHTMPFLRKSSYFPKGPLTFGRRFLITKMLLLNIVFPGSTVGQSISYHSQWAIKGSLWRMQLPDIFAWSNSLGQCAISVGFMGLMAYYAGFYMIFHLIGTNFTYFFGLSPDHDLFPTHVESEKFDKDKKMDWGEMQVRASADFCADSRFITSFMGGINYQIEHHLFPSLCNVYLAEISPIVRRTCAEFGIPYNRIDDPREVFNELCKTYHDAYKND
jgi:linoleoyl-CoA desaturase